MASIHSALWLAMGWATGSGGLHAQEEVLPLPPARDSGIFGLFQNYRTIPSELKGVKPLSAKEKWRLATAKAFDPASFLAAGAIAGLGQAEHQFPSWGQGAVGLGRRTGAAFADLAISDYLAGAVFPILLHEDPRYFRLGHGSALRRIGYSVGRVAITRTDAGSNRFNYSEFLGNATAAAIANAYIPAEDRTAGRSVQKFGTQLGADALINLVKEFLPDIHRKLSRRSDVADTQSALRVP